MEQIFSPSFSLGLHEPLLDKEDLDITVTDRVLTLRGERKQESEKKGKGWTHTERW